MAAIQDGAYQDKENFPPQDPEAGVAMAAEADGLAVTPGQLKDARAQAKRAVTIRVNALNGVLEQVSPELNIIKHKAQELEEAFTQFQEAYEKYKPYAENDSPNYLVEVRDNVTLCLQNAGQFMNSCRGSKALSKASSRRSRRSVVESIHEQQELADSAARLQEAEQMALKYKQEVQRMELELKQAKETHKLEISKAATCARQEALAEIKQQIAEEDANSSVHALSCHSNGSNHGPRDHVPNTGLQEQVLEPGRNPLAAVWEPRTGCHATIRAAENPGILRLIEENQRQQQQMLSAMQLPKTDSLKFDGDPIRYFTFTRSFDHMIKRHNVDNAGKLLHLLSACQGKAKQLVESCMAMDPDEGYTKARQLLEQRYGNEHDIVQTWSNKITQRPVIKSNDNVGLQEYSDELMQCSQILSSVGKLSEVDNSACLVKIVSKLPMYLQNRWRSEVRKIKTRCLRGANFSDLSEFVRKAAEEVNDPIFGNIVSENAGKKDQKPRKDRVYNLVTEAAVSEGSSTGVCLLCGGKHPLFKCDTFKGKNVSERSEFVKEHNLCFNCLRAGHRYGKCKIKVKCSVSGCGKKHNTLLHKASNVSEDKPGATPVKSVVDESAECHAIGAGKSQYRVALPIVPVKVMTTGGRKSFVTYALLDTGSNSSFCTPALASKLGIKGKWEKLCLNTLTQERQNIDMRCVSLKVCDVDEQHSPISMSKVYVKPNMKIGEACIGKQADVNKWPHLQGVNIPDVMETHVQLLIGQDLPQAMMPLEVRAGEAGTPYAVRTVLGWALNGPLSADRGQVEVTEVNYVCRDNINIDSIDSQLKRLWEIEAPEKAYSAADKGWSVEDRKAVSIWDETVKHIDGHYEMAVPFRSKSPDLPNNKEIAIKRLRSLESRFLRDTDLHVQYSGEIQKLIDKGFAQKVPVEELGRNDGKVWYLPHHPVFHPKKPGKLRVVFDCASVCNGISPNSEVLQGPDLTNGLLGVLLRFRQYPVAMMADIEGMFNEVKVSPNDRDALRFLWWEDGDLDRDPTIYRMGTHLFGGLWSPSAANYALRKAASAGSAKFDLETVQTVFENFYVDDYLKSVPDVAQAARLAHDVTAMLKDGGFRLTKWVSNCREVLNTIPIEERAEQIKQINLDSDDSLPVEAALGICWDVDSDSLGFHSQAKENPVTRRGILSILSSVYDPLGLVSPFILRAKFILRELTRTRLGWDEPIPTCIEAQWKEWLSDLSEIAELKIPRCVSLRGATQVKYELHHFSDASLSALGVCSYLRSEDQVTKEAKCCLLMSKAKLTPMKPMTIPRLELEAAALASKLDIVLKRELTLDLEKSTFWTDSQIVLSYISNETKRFQTYVANRVAQIRDQSDPDQWCHVASQSNPGDFTSRGLSVRELSSRSSWLQGPEFLSQRKETWPEQTNPETLGCTDPEVKQETQTYQVTVHDGGPSVLDRLIGRYASWYKLKRAVAWILRFKRFLGDKIKNRKSVSEKGEYDANPRLSVGELQVASDEIIKYVQKQNFHEEIQALEKKKQVGGSSSLKKLDPVMIDGLLCVRGRLANANCNEISKTPVILPKVHHIVTLIVRENHEMAGHVGVEHVLSLTREHFWIIHGRRAVQKTLKNCAVCLRRFSAPGRAKMGNLPKERVTPGDPPFTHVGVDYFGPFYVKRGRGTAKRYGCLFTCLASRAVHLEIASSLETDDFINALTRFMSRRGRMKSLTSDNGKNFVGAQKELKFAIDQLNSGRVEEYLKQKEVTWKHSAPYASHMGKADSVCQKSPEWFVK